MYQVTGLTKNIDGEFMRGPALENQKKFIFRPRQSWRSGTGAKKHVLMTYQEMIEASMSTGLEIKDTT